MTEKRFVNKGKDIFQYGEWWCSANGEHCADVIATAMNELIEENEQLRNALKELKEIGDYQADRIQELSDDNEQLKERNKKRLQRLKNQRKELEKQQEAIWGYKGEIKQLQKENDVFKQQNADWETSFDICKEQKNQLIDSIKEAYLSERTQLGKSVLKQLLESIGVEI